jgi:hypothetical protein
MIDLETETLILPREVCGMFPGRTGKGIALCTAMRWMLKGRKGHKLESLIAGGQRYTSREVVGRFLAKLNGGADYRPQQQRDQRTQEAQRAEHELTAEGF